MYFIELYFLEYTLKYFLELCFLKNILNNFLEFFLKL